jgi:hypothetical protein
MELCGQFRVAIARLATLAGHDHDSPFGCPFDPVFRVAGAELEELIVRQFRERKAD